MPFFDVCDIIVVLIIGSLTVSLSPGTPNLRNLFLQVFTGSTLFNEIKASTLLVHGAMPSNGYSIHFYQQEI